MTCNGTVCAIAIFRQEKECHMHSTTYRWPEGLLDPHHASRRRLVLLLGLVLSLLSCAKIMRPISYQAASTECQKPAQTIQKDFPLSAHLPMPIDVLAKKLRYEPFSIITAKFTKGGSTSAMRLKVQFRDCSVVQVKWRAAPWPATIRLKPCRLHLRSPPAPDR